MKAFLVALAMVIASPAFAQSSASVPPQAYVTVLVDLSATWLSDTEAKLNERLLRQVGSAISSAAGDLEPPIVVRYISIGDRSLGREPLCEVTLSPQIIVNKREKGKVNTVRELADFLSMDCVRFVLSRPNEKFTDITGAFDSVSRAYEEQGGNYKAIIVLSDLREERRPGQRGKIGRLDKTNVVLLYRTLAEDRDNSATLDGRIDAWKKRLLDVGASVKSMSDIFATSGSIAGVLTGGR
jgi:hypothetical protein